MKFRTFLGDPIPYDPNVNAAELAEKVSAQKLLVLLKSVDNLEKHSYGGIFAPQNQAFPL